MIKIHYKEKELHVEEGKSVLELFEQDIKDENALACRFNNEIKSLNYQLSTDGNLKLITYQDKDGKRIYDRGIIYLLTKALYEVEPKALLSVNYQVAGAMYCELDNMEVTDELLARVKARMIEITKQDIPIRKVVMTYEEAEEFYKREKSLKGIVQLDVRDKDGVSLYYCGDYYNYLYGVMPVSTGIIKTYDVQKYRDGFYISFPDKENSNVIKKHKENKNLFKTLEEYEDIHKILEINTLYKLNNKVTNGTITDNILLAEALHEKKIAEIADKIAKKQDIKMVLIAGPSSSGKTTFAQRLGLQLKLNGLKPVTISVDNYFVEREETPKDSNGNYDFECIEAIDLKLFNEQLTALLEGKEVYMPMFDFQTGKKHYSSEPKKLMDDEILVIEGIHCLNDKLTNSIPRWKKYKVYISALTVLNIDYHNRISTTDTRLIRRIVRDNQFRGYPAIHTLQMWYSVNRGEMRHIFPFQEEADTMFNSSLIYELGVLRDYAVPLLKEIDNTKTEYSEARRLIRLLNFFEPIGIEDIPKTSLIREFIGGSIFKE